MTELPPGRELDALIAEKICGHKVIKSRHWHFIREEQWYLDVDCGEYLPPYSTSIADAWLVVEKLKPIEITNNSKTLLAGAIGTEQIHKWFISICVLRLEGSSDWMNSKYVYASSETLPHAICLAALKAIDP